MALITLTRDQFLKRKPGGNYKSYLSYVNAARAGRPVGQGVGPQVQLPLNPNAVNQALLRNVMSGGLDPKQMRKQAVQSVNDAIKTALGELRSTTAAAQLQATHQAQGYEGFARALGEMRRSDADYVSGLYRDAGADQARFAAGITGAVGDAARADAAAQQADIAAATGQSAGYHGPDPGATQSVGYFLGGQLPAARLAENAVYAGTDALRQGLASAARLGIEGAGMRGKAIDLQGELARKRAELIAGKPAAIREAMKGLADDQRANLATLANVLYLQNAQAKTTAEQTGQYQGQDTIDTYRDANGVLRHYDPNRYRVKTSRNGSQFLEPLPVAKSGSSTEKNAAGRTVSGQDTYDRAVNKALQTNRSHMLTAVQNQKGPLWTQPNSLYQGLPGYEPKRKDYATARSYLLTNYANDLMKQYPKQKAQILAAVDEVLASAGFKRKAAAKPTKPLPPGGLASVVGGWTIPAVPKKGR